MSAASNRPDWDEDRIGMTDEPMLDQLAELVGVPAIPGAVWRGAAVTLLSTNAQGVTTGYLQVVKDVDWLVPDKSMIRLAIDLLQHKHDGTSPG